MSATAMPLSPPAHRQRDTSLYGMGSDDRLIKLHEVKALTSYGATSIYAKIKQNVFPAPVKPCAGDSSRWVLGEIRQFNAKAIAERDRLRGLTGSLAPAPSMELRT
jgi:predicted DNA-binding transcriptional regulator AlpA